MMKVLMTVDTIGGVWNYAIDLITALNQYRVEAALVSMGRKLSTQQRKQIAQLKNVQFFETTYKLEWMDDPWQDVKEAGEYLLEINDLIKPDIVHLNSYSHASLNFTAPVLVVAHSCVYSWYEAVFNRKPPAKWKKYFENVSLGLRAADSVTAPTHTMIKSLLKIYGRFNCTAPIYNGRNFICRQSEKLPFVFTAGRLWDDSKNIEAIQDAAEKIIWPVYAAGEKKHPDGYTKKFKSGCR
jgi:hypothetical protein